MKVKDKVEIKKNGEVHLYFNNWSVEELQVVRDVINKVLDEDSKKHRWLHKLSMGDPLVYTQIWTPGD